MYLTSWWLGKFPEQRVILTSYGADLASYWSGRSRDTLEQRGMEVFGVQPEGAADAWRVAGHNGGMRSAGVGGGITGHGADCLISDDLIKNAEEARSETIRNATWDWWTSTALTRLEPNAVVIMIATRWSLDDPIGRALKFAEENPDSEQWTIFNMPAIATEDEPPPPLGMGRKQGEALWPERYDVDNLKQTEIQLGAYWWNALYQGSPIPAEGGMFRLGWFNQRQKAAPYQAQRVRSWDIASSAKGTACFTVGTLVSYVDGITYIEDVVRGQWAPGERNDIMLATAHRDRARYGPNHEPRIFIEKQPGAAGIDLHRDFCKLLAGFAVFEYKPTGSKETRSEPLAAQCASGNVKLVEGAWIGPWLDELTSFPFGATADQVDSASAGFNILASSRPAGTVRFLRPGQQASRSLHIAVLTKDELRTEEVAEHTCFIINCVDPGNPVEVPEHRLSKVLDTITVSCLDKAAEDYQDYWHTPIDGRLPEQLILSRDAAKALWVQLLMKRPEGTYIDVIVVVDSDDGDRRGLSVALAITKALSLPVAKTVWAKRYGENWHADDKTAADVRLVNSHVYDMVKQGRAMVIGGTIPLRPAPNSKKRSWALLGDGRWLK
jgi:predicted phage terminase large subunit-like protein